jgi:hypothetical protein
MRQKRNLLSLVQSELETIGYLVPGVTANVPFIPADPQRVYLWIMAPTTVTLTLLAKLDRGTSQIVVTVHKLTTGLELSIDSALKLVTEEFNIVNSGEDAKAIGVRYKGSE